MIFKKWLKIFSVVGRNQHKTSKNLYFNDDIEKNPDFWPIITAFYFRYVEIGFVVLGVIEFILR